MIAYSTVRRLLNDAVERTGLRDAAGEPMTYTAHDFRRMFLTEAVTGGLPVHIAARVLGHHSLNTTQAYLAVFQDDLIRAYRGFLDARRATRPQDDYREPTDAEWQEFQQHFELRKVELAAAAGPTQPPAATNTPASGVRCCGSTPTGAPDSSRSSATSATTPATVAENCGVATGVGSVGPGWALGWTRGHASGRRSCRPRSHAPLSRDIVISP